MIAYVCLFNGVLNITNTLSTNRIYECLESQMDIHGCPFKIVPCEIFELYEHHIRNMYAEVEILGIDVIKKESHCTNKIRVIRFLSHDNLFKLSTGIFNCYGTVKHYQHGLLHNDKGPALIYVNGTQVYYVNGKIHRLKGPAIICTDGTTKYYRNGLLHRLYKPAIISEYCDHWYHHGEFVKMIQKNDI